MLELIHTNQPHAAMTFDAQTSAETQLDIFGTGAQVQTPAASVPAQAPAAPWEIAELSEVYHAELAFRTKITQDLAALNARIGALPGRISGIELTSSRYAIGHSRDTLGAWAERVESVAQRLLGTPNAPFLGSLRNYVASQNDVFLSFFRLDTEEVSPELAAAFDPVTLWAELSKQHDPNRQLQWANKAAAHKIRGEFGMRRGAARWKEVGGRVEVSIQVWSEVAHGGGRRLGYNSRVHELGDALQQAMAHSDLVCSFGQRFASMCVDLGRYSGNNIVSRQRVDLGDGVDVVLGFSAFKLYLPKGIAGAVNLFLAEYPDDLG